MDKDLIKRINELAKKKKTLGLNAEEQAEQKQLYAVYLAEIREQFDNTLDNAVSYTHLRAHETRHDLVCRLLLEKKKPSPRNGLLSRMPSSG